MLPFWCTTCELSKYRHNIGRISRGEFSSSPSESSWSGVFQLGAFKPSDLQMDPAHCQSRQTGILPDSNEPIEMNYCDVRVHRSHERTNHGFMEHPSDVLRMTSFHQFPVLT